MPCKTCDDGSGLLWDSLRSCPDCDKGKEIQHGYDKTELKLVEKRARILRKKIKAYKEKAMAEGIKDKQSEIVTVKGKKLFEFNNFNDWLNTAQNKFLAVNLRPNHYLCVDTQGNVCIKGVEFMTARDSGYFPVTVYQVVFDS